MKMPDEVKEIWQNVCKSPRIRDYSFVYCYELLNLQSRWGPLKPEQLKEYEARK